MPKYNYHQNSFRAGELSPKAYSRTDVDAYRLGCKQLKNFINYPQGGVYKRPGTIFVTNKILSPEQTDPTGTGLLGTRFVAATGNISENSFLVPVQLTNGKSYIVILDKRAYGAATGVDIDTWEQIFIKNGSINTNNATIGPLPVYNGFASAGSLDELSYAFNGDLTLVAHEDVCPFHIAPPSELGAGAKYYSADGTDLHIAQLHIYSFHERAGAAGAYLNWWPVLHTDRYNWMPFQDLNTNGITLTPSAITQGSAGTLVASAAMFTADHVGVIYGLLQSSAGFVVVTSFVDTTHVLCRTLETLPASDGYSNWFEGAWSDLRGWPKNVTFAQQRTVFGGNRSFPEELWFSQTNDIYQMMDKNIDISQVSDVTADSAFRVSIASERAVQMQWLYANQKSIVVGGKEREFVIYGSEESGISASSIQVSSETAYGSEKVQPVKVDERPIFAQGGGQHVRDLYFNRDQNQYISQDLTFLAEHFARKSYENYPDQPYPKVKQMVHQKNPNSLIWVKDSNGKAFAITRSALEQTLAFHDHEFGGFSDDAETLPPKVLSMCAIRSASSTEDQVWMIVKRVIDGNPFISLEYMNNDFKGATLDIDSDNIDKQPVFLDCATMLKKQEPNFYASLSTTVNAEVAGGSGTGVATGSPTFSSGSLDCSGGAGKYVTYDGTSNADFAQIGCIRIQVKIDEADLKPAGHFHIFTIAKSSVSDINLITLKYDTSGIFRLTVKDSGGSTAINDVVVSNRLSGRNQLAQDKFVELELNYNFTAGVTRLFVDGVQGVDSNGDAVTITTTCTRDTNIDLIRVGTDRAASTNSDGLFNHFMIFNSVQHTENYKPSAYYDGGQMVNWGLEIYETSEVSVVADGNYLGDFTVDLGIIDLGAGNDDFERLLIGYKYNSQLKIMEVEDGSAIGSSQGSIGRIDRAAVRFLRACQAKVGMDEDTVETLLFRDTDDDVGQPITLFSGLKLVDFLGDYERGENFYLEAPDPLPCGVSSVTLRGMNYD